MQREDKRHFPLWREETMIQGTFKEMFKDFTKRFNPIGDKFATDTIRAERGV